MFLDPLSAASHGLARLIRAPELAHSSIYRLVVPHWMVSQVAEADIAVVEQPYLFDWVRRVRSREAPVVYASHNVEAAMFDFGKIRAPKIIAKKIAEEIIAQERRAVCTSDLVLTTCEADAQTMGERYGAPRSRFLVVPNGVDCVYFRPFALPERVAAKAKLNLADKRVVLFCGAKHPPNTEAVKHILAWAALENDPAVQFVIVGSVANSFRGFSSGNVTFAGFVDDIRPYYAAADIAVNPTMSGGGTNLKQVEYLAAGIPSIVTEFGCRGTGVVDGVHALVRQPSEFSNANVLLQGNPELSARIAENGRVLAQERFDWAAISRKLVDAYWALTQRSKTT